MTSLVVPGQPLGPVSAYIPGPGVHVFNGQIIASLVGQVVTNPQTTTTTSTSTAVPPTISVQKPVLTTDEETNATLLPDVSSTVLCRITRINPRQATASIFIVNNHICGDEFQGVIRVQDVRLTEVDKVKIFNSFRPGDIVRAKVISLGDQSNYYLSTASNELGVIMADSEMGDPMYPINWKEMKSTRTGVVEERKVAKPF
ncbi:exosome 3'-_5 exonuclease subunit ski4 (Csl4) [Orbilia oligospora]|uniref:Exosome 3'->5 exonuclease subunit ski4 (Csl4) n=1 Tax=Orbilia oligospora TaxID=2813651 RepID=A0A7C8KAJ5_ORBOL|nr:exosome 3'->5 exonuclease subunit ski4 (Csl4) [Orbilia oligospora]